MRNSEAECDVGDGVERGAALKGKKMAIHEAKLGHILEGLVEMLHVAEYAINYRKTDRAQWGDYATGGILGYPSAVVLFSVIDCLGSVFAGDDRFSVSIDGKSRQIRRANEHIYILNSKYFNLDLGLIDLDNLYMNVRSTLVHNSLLPAGYHLQIGEDERLPFCVAVTESDERFYFVNLVRLYEAVHEAVRMLFDDLRAGDVQFERSLIHSNVSRRDVETPYYLLPNGQIEIRFKQWIRR